MAKAPIEIRSLARSHTETALKTLKDIMEDPEVNPSARVNASTALLDRGWGKPSQSIEHSGPEGGPIQTESLTDEDASRRMVHIMNKALRDRTEGKTKK